MAILTREVKGEICKKYLKGNCNTVTIESLADEFEITEKRVLGILRRNRVHLHLESDNTPGICIVDFKNDINEGASIDQLSEKYQIQPATVEKLSELLD